jgi:hypothetical protein
MEPLAEILDVERGIGEMLEGERSKAAQWLLEKRREVDQAAQIEIERLKATSARDEIALRDRVEARATALVQQAAALADRIKGLDDERLTRIVWDHLQAIAPGLDRDRQNVED